MSKKNTILTFFSFGPAPGEISGIESKIGVPEDIGRRPATTDYMISERLICSNF